MALPTGPTAPQFAQVPIAVVTSNAKSCSSVPAAAFPSSFISFMSASCGPESFCLDARRRVAALDEYRCDRLHEPGRAADERDRFGLGVPPDLGEHLAVHPPRKALPADRLVARQGEERVEALIASGELVQLVPV